MKKKERQAIFEQMRRALESPDPRKRHEAIDFFTHVKGPEEGGALVAALRDLPELFTGFPDPTFPEGPDDLRRLLGIAIASRACERGETYPGELEVLKAEALTPGMALGVTAGLMYLDLAWVEENAAAIARGTPLVLEALLFNLLRRERPVIPLIREPARDFPRDRLEAAVAAELPDELKARARLVLESH